MRDIKFRGCEWNADNELLPFVYGKLCDVDVIRTIKGVDKVVHYKTVGQFAGLYDKNGEEIYEGDKCKVTFYNYVEKNTEIIMEVVFTEGGFALIKEGKITTECIMEDDRTFVPLYYSQKPNSIEVIGNIHTTPELLNPSN